MTTLRGVDRLLLCVCTLIVAAFHAPLAAAVVIFEDVPVSGGVEALARSLAIDPAPERARFMFEVTRLVHENAEIRSPAVAAFLQSVRQSARAKGSAPVMPRGASQELVPLPLNADLWSDAVFKKKIAREDLVLAIVADRQASWLCHGLARLDDETLEYFAGHTSLLSRLYERSSPVFAAFAETVHIRDNRVVPPGGADAVPLWEAVVGEKVTRADRFVQTLFESSDGRLAYLFDTIGQLDPAHRAFALGLWLPNATARLDRFKSLAVAATGIREWHVRLLPFNRSSYDLSMAFTRLAVDENGVPAAPNSRGLWARAFGTADSGEDAPIDAAWLAENLVLADVRQRGERLDQIAFAQRVFGAADVDRVELVFVLRALPKFRAPFLAFDRIGIRQIGTYAALVRQASRLTSLDGRRGYVVQAQFQGALVLITRMAAVRTFDAAAADRLIHELLSVPFEGNSFSGGVARWIRERLHPALPASRDFESAVIAGLAGPPPPENAPRVTWEGQNYRLDLAAAERIRLQHVREKQGAPALDIPMQMAEAARTLATEKISIEEVQDIATQFGAIATDLPERSREEEADNVPAGVPPPPSTHEALRKAAGDLARAIKNNDVKRVARIAEPIVEVADDLLARNLLSFAYAIHVGEPDGAVLLADDVSHRHDFGLGLKDGEMRSRLTWAVPRQEVAPGVSWHVSGSLLGLEVGLATLALRRVATDRVLEAPKLTTNARDMFATTVSLMDPRALDDAGRDAIADAIARGHERATAAADPARADAMAAELGVEMPRRRALRWTLAHDPDQAESLLSMTELLVLGGGRPPALQAWGMAVPPTSGCFCPRLQAPGAWATLAGRPQLGLAASVLPDLNLRVAIVLKELNLPAPLARVVLSAAMQDFIDDARPTDDSDWLSLSRIARTVTRERIEDYIAAATATGPLVPDTGRAF